MIALLRRAVFTTAFLVATASLKLHGMWTNIKKQDLFQVMKHYLLIILAVLACWALAALALCAGGCRRATAATAGSPTEVPVVAGVFTYGQTQGGNCDYEQFFFVRLWDPELGELRRVEATLEDPGMIELWQIENRGNVPCSYTQNAHNDRSFTWVTLKCGGQALFSHQVFGFTRSWDLDSFDGSSDLTGPSGDTWIDDPTNYGVVETFSYSSPSELAPWIGVGSVSYRRMNLLMHGAEGFVGQCATAPGFHYGELVRSCAPFSFRDTLYVHGTVKVTYYVIPRTQG